MRTATLTHLSEQLTLPLFCTCKIYDLTWKNVLSLHGSEIHPCASAPRTLCYIRRESCQFQRLTLNWFGRGFRHWSVLVSFITLISGCCTLASVVIIASIVFGERGSRRLRMCCLIPIQLVLSDPLFQDRRVLERVSQVCESNHRRGPWTRMEGGHDKLADMYTIRTWILHSLWAFHRWCTCCWSGQSIRSCFR